MARRLCPLGPTHHAGRLLALHPRAQGGSGARRGQPLRGGSRSTVRWRRVALMRAVGRTSARRATSSPPLRRRRRSTWGRVPGGSGRSAAVARRLCYTAAAGPGWVRLRPELSGICSSDLGVDMPSRPSSSPPFTAEQQILGHEIVAVVAETGPEVTRVVEGDRGDRGPGDRVFTVASRRSADPAPMAIPYVCERFDLPGVSGCCSPTLGF